MVNLDYQLDETKKLLRDSLRIPLFMFPVAFLKKTGLQKSFQIITETLEGYVMWLHMWRLVEGGWVV